MDYLFKLLIIGDAAAGKSSLLVRFTDKVYLADYVSTIGVDYRIKTLNINRHCAKLQIWDCAG